MRREFSPSPMRLALPVLKWCAFLIVVGGIGRWWSLFVVSVVVLIFHAAFHRNPRRKLPVDPSVLVAPGDGKITDIIEVDEPKFIKGKVVRVGIFLSVFDVHVQPSPCDATLKWVDYQPGKFLDVRDANASSQNESQFLGLETTDGVKLGIRQIAGLIARRIILWRLIHEEVRRGELLGMIRYGSRIELYLPVGFAEILVKPGQRVQGGCTPIAKRR